MIENIRKYTGLTIIVIALVFIGFLFLDSSSMRSGPGGDRVALKIDGRAFGEREFRKSGMSALQLTGAIAQMGDFQMFEFRIAMVGDAMGGPQEPQQFFLGRQIIRLAGEEFGIHPGEQAISSFIRSLRPFTGPDGAFNDDIYRNFVTVGIGHLGLTEQDLRDLVGDMLTFQKLSDVLGSGLRSDRDFIAKSRALDNQQITASMVRLDLQPFVDEMDPSDAEIEEYWSTIKDLFRTEPMRRITYVLATPDLPPVPTDEPDEPESIAEAAATDEAKAAMRLEKQKAKDEKMAAYTTAKLNAERDAADVIDDFLYELENTKGKDFEAIAESMKLTPVTTEFFSATEPPAELQLNLREIHGGGLLAPELFRVPVTQDPFSRISKAMPVGENQWLAARVDEVQEARTKTFEEAKAEARAQFISEKAGEKLKNAADAKSEEIRKAMADGASFADAATAAGFAEVHRAEAVTSAHQAATEVEPTSLFEAVGKVTPGTLAEPVIEADRAFLVFVEKRELVRDEDLAGRIDDELETNAEELKRRVVNSWIALRKENVRLEVPAG